MLGPSSCSNPDPINGHTRGSISQALGCQMWYGITLAVWRKGAQPDWLFKASGSHQSSHLNQDSDWCCEVMRGKEMRGVDPACPLLFSEACLIGTVTFHWLMFLRLEFVWRGDNLWSVLVIHVLFVLSLSLLSAVMFLNCLKKSALSPSVWTAVWRSW